MKGLKGKDCVGKRTGGIFVSKLNMGLKFKGQEIQTCSTMKSLPF